MPLTRRHARIPAAIALVALAAVAVLWVLARTAFARGLVADAIADATGLPAAVESLGVGFLPSPTFDIGGITVGQPPGFGDEPLLTVGQARVRLPWSAVFGGSGLGEVEASDATVRLVVDRAGTANWSKLGGEEPAGTTAAPEAPADWSIGSLKLERGVVDYRDLAAGSQWQLAAIGLAADGVAPRTAFPFDLKLGGVFGENTAHFAVRGEGFADTAGGSYEGRGLEFRGWLGGEPLPLAGAELTGRLARAAYSDASGAAEFEDGRFEFAEVPGRFEGRAEFGGDAASAKLSVATEAFAPRATAIILGQPLPATTDPEAFSALQLVIAAQLDDGVLRLEPVTGRLDDTNFTASAVPERRSLRAELDRIDLDRYLPAPPRSGAGRATAAKKDATLEALAAELAELDLDAEIRIGEARVAGAVLRDAVVRVERSAEAAP